jgi:hypothetical protein
MSCFTESQLTIALSNWCMPWSWVTWKITQGGSCHWYPLHPNCKTCKIRKGNGRLTNHTPSHHLPQSQPTQ